MYKKIIFIILIISTMIITFQVFRSDIKYTSSTLHYLTVSEMKADISQIESEFMKLHPDAKENPEFYKIFFNEMASSIKTVHTVSEFSTILAAKLASLNDAHTRVLPEISGATLPLILKIIDGEYYVLKGYSKIEVGDKILSIGGINIHIIFNEYAKQYSSENLYWKQEQFEEIYIETDKVISLGGKKTFFGAFEIKYKRDESIKSVSIFEDDCIDKQYNDSLRNEILYSTKNMKNVVESKFPSFKYSVNLDENYVYYLIRDCIFNSEYVAITDQVFNAIEKGELDNLIIDLRGNGGGTTEVNRYFKEKLDFYNFNVLKKISSGKSLKLFILVDHKTCSGAVFFANEMKTTYNSVIIGQPTGGTMPCYGDATYEQLDNSKIYYAISKAYFSSYDKSNSDSLYPDYTSYYDIFDYFNGTDKDLDIVKRLLSINVNSLTENKLMY